MDQQAFRALLSTPRAGGSGSGASPSGSGAAGSASRQFGVKRRREPAASTSQITARDLAPRSVASASSSAPKRPAAPATNSATGEKYVDRATARREGRDEENEYAQVERLKEEFEQRMQNVGEEERGALEQQMAFLGGDAKHSILVRGLDYALLAQERARAEGAGSGAADDDLESAYAARGKAEDKASSSAAAEEEKEGVLAELAKRKLEDAAASKFKPIGAKKAEQEKPEYIWKDGKRMRKKRKVVPPPQPSADEASAAASKEKEAQQQAAEAEDSRAMPPPPPRMSAPSRDKKGAAGSKAASSERKSSEQKSAPTKPAASASPAPRPPAPKPASDESPSQAAPAAAPAPPQPAAAESDSDDDGDIFDAPAWTGVPEGDSDDDEAEAVPSTSSSAAPPAATDAAPAPKKIDYFAGLGSASSDPAPGRSETEASEAHALMERVRSAAPAEEAEEAEARPGRLQGLSSSALPAEVSRELLAREMEAARKADEKKAAGGPAWKKGKKKGKEEQKERAANDDE